MCHTDVLTRFDVICDLLLGRRMETWNLFVLDNKQTEKCYNYVMYNDYMSVLIKNQSKENSVT